MKDPVHVFFLHNRARNSKLKRIAISGRLLILVGVMYEKFNVVLQDFEMLLGFSGITLLLLDRNKKFRIVIGNQYN